MSLEKHKFGRSVADGGKFLACPLWLPLEGVASGNSWNPPSRPFDDMVKEPYSSCSPSDPWLLASVSVAHPPVGILRYGMRPPPLRRPPPILGPCVSWAD
jgi:hypothetical protein